MKLKGIDPIAVGVTTVEECCLPRIVLAMKVPARGAPRSVLRISRVKATGEA
jgi:hypothetical protein